LENNLSQKKRDGPGNPDLSLALSYEISLFYKAGVLYIPWKITKPIFAK
jgi:hypothetical protein